MLIDVGWSLIVGVCGWGVLSLFFAAVSFKWPTSYSQVHSELDAHHRRGLARFLLVRVFPISVVAATTAHISRELGALPAIAVSAMLLCHLSQTDFRALYRARPMPPQRLAYHLAAILGAFVSTLSGALIGLSHSAIFPSLGEVRGAVWTAAIVAILGAAYLRGTSSQPSQESRLDWVKRDVGFDFWDKVPEIALENNADPHLVQAIVAAEAVQRPRWIRRLESWWPWSATHGVAQMNNSRTLSNVESVAKLSQTLAEVSPDRSMGYFRITPMLELRLERHNPSQAFIADCKQFLELLESQVDIGSDALGPDGHPAITLRSVERVADQLQVVGTACYDASIVQLRDEFGNEIIAEGTLRKVRARQQWTVTTPIDVNDVEIRLVTSTGKDPTMNASLRENFPY